MFRRYYFDTSIWLDFYEKRGGHGEKALKLIKQIVENDNIILFSDFHAQELKNLGYGFNEIVEMIGAVRKNVRKVHIFKEEKESAKEMASRKNVPAGDVLHAILARDNEAQLISRDEHFDRLKDISIAKKPEEIT